MTSLPSTPVDKPAKFMDHYLDLLKQGRVAEARNLLEDEKVRAKYEPDTITAVKGKGMVFHKGRTKVEKGSDGIWRPVPKKPKT